MTGFRSASLPLQKGIRSRLETAFAVAGEVCPWVVNPAPMKSLPFGVLGTDTEIDSGPKDRRDSGMTHTLRIYSLSFVEAARYAAIAIAALTDEDEWIKLDEGFAAASPGRLEMHEPITERDERGDIYSRAIRIRWDITKA